MTFGYHANIWVNHTIDGLDTPVFDLIHSLKVEREVSCRLLFVVSKLLTKSSAGSYQTTDLHRTQPWRHSDQTSKFKYCP